MGKNPKNVADVLYDSMCSAYLFSSILEVWRCCGACQLRKRAGGLRPAGLLQRLAGLLDSKADLTQSGAASEGLNQPS